MRSMFPPASAIAPATDPKSSGPTPIPITVTTDMGRVGVGVSSTFSNSTLRPRSQPKKSKIPDRGPLTGDPDEHVEGQTAADDDLLDVVDLDLLPRPSTAISPAEIPGPSGPWTATRIVE